MKAIWWWKYLVKPLFEFVDVAGELESLELELFNAFDEEEVENLFGNKVPEVANH